MEKPLGFMFMGRSGCGKGTQAELLQKFLEDKGEKGNILHIYVGNRLRELFLKETYTAKVAEDITSRGKLQPAFLAMWAWSTDLVENIKEGNHIIFDGSPRRLIESKYVDEAMEFYEMGKVYPVVLGVSRDWARERLLGRGRNDDSPDSIEERLNFYDKEVVPVLDYFRDESKNKLIEINGEQSIEDVHKEVIKKIFNE